MHNSLRSNAGSKPCSSWWSSDFAEVHESPNSWDSKVGSEQCSLTIHRTLNAIRWIHNHCADIPRSVKSVWQRAAIFSVHLTAVNKLIYNGHVMVI